ncbi:MAG: hypothetical protein JW908_16940 [Anaerolineales bacterium]|nr:hypothetical protein [Anaerolineales bacterium]
MASAAISWGIFSIVLVSVFWESYYQYFYPSWLRSVWLLVFVPILYGALAMVFHWLALHIPGNPIFNFCVLVGIEAVLEHTWGIYGLHILKIPLLQDVNLASILVFSVPEYIFYWCIVITIAILIYNIRIGKKK